MPAAKKPQDRQPKATSGAVEELNRKAPEGVELLRPLDEIPVWDQAPMFKGFMDIFEEGAIDEEAVAKENKKRDKAGKPPLTEEEKKTFRDFDIELVGRLGKALLAFAKDEAEFTKFVSGKDAMQRTVTLAMWWVSELGESFGSES